MTEKRRYVTARMSCPNWTCGGNLYVKERKGEEMWKSPDIVCDDCHTVFHNSEADRMAEEETRTTNSSRKEKKKT